MTVEEAVADRAVEEVEPGFDIGVRRDLAAFDRAAEDRAGLVAARRGETCAVFARECGVGLGFGDQRRDRTPVRPYGRLLASRGPGAQQAEQVTAQ